MCRLARAQSNSCLLACRIEQAELSPCLPLRERCAEIQPGDWPDDAGNTTWVADTNSIYSLSSGTTVLTTTAEDVNFFTGTIPEGETLVWQRGMEIEQDVLIHHHKKITNLVHSIVP